MTREKIDPAAPVVAGSVAAVTHAPTITPRAATDAGVLARERLFREAVHQTRPLAPAGSSLEGQAVRLLRAGNARHAELADATARRFVTEPRTLGELVGGAQPKGKLAEVVAVDTYKRHQQGENVLVGSLPRPAPNVVDVRINPDPQARRDLLFLLKDPQRGRQFFRPGGQVKNGASSYVCRGAESLLERVGYGETVVVDARFVNPDGTPRVGADAFNESEARRLLETRVRLRGVRDMELHAERLGQDVRAAERDGLGPEARARLQQLRDDVAAAYHGRSVAGRAVSGAAMAAATAAIVSLAVQAASGGDVDVAQVTKAAGQGAVAAGAGIVSEAALYHAATAQGLGPEAAQAFARQGVAVGFCLVAVGADLWDEVSAARRGEVTPGSALLGASVKAGLDVLPLVLAPLGLWSVPLVIVAHLGGRWWLGSVRAADRALERQIEVDRCEVMRIDTSLSRMQREADAALRTCDETDAIVASVMSGAHTSPCLP